MSQAALEFTRFDTEHAFAERVTKAICAVFTGTTDEATRKERIRRAILAADLGPNVHGRNAKTGKSETYAETFERVYGEPLNPHQSARKPKASSAG